MSANEYLPDVLSDIVKEYTTASFRLKDDKLQVYASEPPDHKESMILELKAKPGLWFVHWTPTNFIPRIGDTTRVSFYRILLLQHEKTTINDGLSLFINNKERKEMLSENSILAQNIVLCSKLQPLLNIELTRAKYTTNTALLSTVIMADGLIGLIVESFKSVRMTKAADVVLSVIDEKMRKTLTKINLLHKLHIIHEYVLKDLSATEVESVTGFKPQSKNVRSFNLQFDPNGSVNIYGGNYTVNLSLDLSKEKIRDIYLGMISDVREAILLSPLYGKLYIKAYQEEEKKNPALL